jgi:integrase
VCAPCGSTNLRHTFATQVAAAGVPPRTLQEWLGHGDLGMVTRYADYVQAPDEAGWLERAFQPSVTTERAAGDHVGEQGERN